MGDEFERVHEELKQYGERWRATVPSAPIRDANRHSLPGHRWRLLVPGAAAAAILVVVAGVALGTGLSKDGRHLSDTGPTPTTTPAQTGTPTPIALGKVVPWEPLDPTGTRAAAGGIAGHLEVTNDPAPGEQLTFMVTLTARWRDVSLVRCPDYSIVDRWSWDDVGVATFALNCAAVPYRDSAGAPHLPEGVPVTFEMRGSGPGPDGGPEKATWKLKAPGGPSLPIPLAGDTCSPVPPRRLPSGTSPGKSRPFTSDYGDALAWGRGDDRVVQLPGANPLGLGENWPKQVAFRTTRARVTGIGDPGEIAFVFAIGACTYTNWIGPGVSMSDAETYIPTF